MNLDLHLIGANVNMFRLSNNIDIFLLFMSMLKRDLPSLSEYKVLNAIAGLILTFLLLIKLFGIHSKCFGNIYRDLQKSEERPASIFPPDPGSLGRRRVLGRARQHDQEMLVRGPYGKTRFSLLENYHPKD